MQNQLRKITITFLTSVLLLAALIVAAPGTAQAAAVGDAVFSDTYSPSLSAGQKNVVARAKTMSGVTWTAKKKLSAYYGQSSFRKGFTYMGVPYCQAVDSGKYVLSTKDINTFLKAAGKSSSVFYKKSGRNGSITGPYYGNDCSAFVSYCFGISRLTTSSISTSNKFKTIGNAPKTVNKLQVGDILNKGGTHVALVTDLQYSMGVIRYIEITEQVSPNITTELYTVDQFKERFSGYKHMRYRQIKKVKAPTKYSGQTSQIKLTNLWDGGNAFYAYLYSDSTGKYLGNDSSVGLVGHTNDARQVWHFYRNSNGKYAIISAYDGKYLAPGSSGSLTTSENEYLWSVYAKNNYLVLEYNKQLLKAADGKVSLGSRTVQDSAKFYITKLHDAELNQAGKVSASVKSGGNVTLSWKSVKGAAGYQLQIYNISTDKTEFIRVNKTSYTLKLSSGWYYVRVAGRMSRYGVQYYGQWQDFSV